MKQYAVRVPDRRRRRVAISAAVGFVILSAFVLSSPAPHRVEPLQASARQPSASAVVQTPSSTTAETSPVAATAVPAVNVVQGPPDSSHGIVVVATPLVGGTVSITETATFDVPQRSLVLSPPQIARAGKGFDTLHPTASQVELAADGRKVVLASTTLTHAVTISLVHAALKLELRYLLAGVVAPTGSGATTSADSGTTSAAALEPLLSGFTEQLHVSYVVGAGVSSFRCPELAASQQSCAPTASPIGLLRGLPANQSLVVVTLTTGAPPPTTGGTSVPTSPVTTPGDGTTTTAGSDPTTPVDTATDPSGTDTSTPTDPATTDPATTAPTDPATSDPTQTTTSDPTDTSTPTDTTTSAPPPEVDVPPAPEGVAPEVVAAPEKKSTTQAADPTQVPTPLSTGSTTATSDGS